MRMQAFIPMDGFIGTQLDFHGLVFDILKRIGFQRRKVASLVNPPCYTMLELSCTITTLDLLQNFYLPNYWCPLKYLFQ